MTCFWLAVHILDAYSLPDSRGQNHIDEPEINIRICPFVNTQKGSWCILSQPEESKACITVYFLEAGRCQNSKMRSPFLTIPVPDAFVAALCPEEKKRMLSIIFAGWSKDRTTEGAENTHVRQAEILQLELLRSGKVRRHYLLPSDGLQTMCLRMTSSTLQVYPASRGRLEKHNIAFIKKAFPKKILKTSRHQVTTAQRQAGRVRAETVAWEKQSWGRSGWRAGQAGRELARINICLWNSTEAVPGHACCSARVCHSLFPQGVL